LIRFNLPNSETADPLSAAATQRFEAMHALLQGQPDQALRAFPTPQTPRLPSEWALEGALLAALAEAWPLCSAYYRVALRSPLTTVSDLHPYIWWTCFLETAPPCTEVPQPPSKESTPKDSASLIPSVFAPRTM